MVMEERRRSDVEVFCLDNAIITLTARQGLLVWKNSASEGWQGVRKVVIAEVEAERQAAESGAQ